MVKAASAMLNRQEEINASSGVGKRDVVPTTYLRENSLIAQILKEHGR